MSILGSRDPSISRDRCAVIAGLAVIFYSCLAWGATPAASRPETWAHPLKLAGVENLYRISRDLYRSRQPSALGMENLRKMGIKTIVNLRSFHWDRSKIRENGLVCEHIYMKPWHPEEEDAVRFLRIVTGPGRTPVLVHCRDGADRTGAMVALYRIAVQDWTKEEAIREMTSGGFGFHPIWGNLPRWLMKLDIERLKRQSGLK